MPVLPEVGSISTVSGPIAPARSIASTIETPMRSFTLAAGLRHSSFAKMGALTLCMSGNRRSRTSGVSPIASVIESKIRPRPGRRLDFNFFAAFDREVFMRKNATLYHYHSADTVDGGDMF